MNLRNRISPLALWRRAITVAAAIMTMAPTARAATFAADLFGAWTEPRAIGTIHRVNARVDFGSRLLPGAGVTWVIRPVWLLSAGVTRGSSGIGVRVDGAPAGRSTINFGERSLVLRRLFPLSDSFALSAGAGVASLTVRNLRRPVSSGDVTLIRASSPDHGEAIVTAGVRRRITPRLSLTGDVEYGPFRSTVEVRRIERPQDDLEADFHLLVVKAGISFAF